MSTSVDFLGRRFQVGPEPGELVGRDRAWMLRASWAAMAAIGILQYGFGSLVPSLVDRGWSALDVFWLLALWTVFQAGAGFPVAFLRERGRIGPRTAMIAGAVLLPLGPLSLAFGSQFAAVIGYSPLLNLALEKHDPDYMRRDAYLPMSQVEALKDRWAGGPEPIARADSPSSKNTSGVQDPSRAAARWIFSMRSSSSWRWKKSAAAASAAASRPKRAVAVSHASAAPVMSPARSSS